MKKVITSIVFATGLSSVVLAQTPAATPQSAGGASSYVAGQTTLGVDVTTYDWIAIGYRASKILKSDVYNEKGDKIGKIDDLIIKPDGTINVAIVDVGGFLGMKVHRVAVPVGQFTSVKPKIVLPGATKESLKAAPEFKYAK
jgi:sporulation protein YlmC with PRC-barrel domain